MGEKAGLLNLLWVLHFYRTPITIFVIRKLLCLVHDGCLWVEEPIPITTDLIHHVSQLPCKGEYPMNISEGKGSDLDIMEAMKKNYKLEKKKRGYTISSIKEKAVCVVTQILVGKVMRKYRTDEVPVPVVALAEQCADTNAGDACIDVEKHSRHRGLETTYAIGQASSISVPC